MIAALSLKVFENEKLEDAIKAAGGIGYAAVEIRTCPTQLPISTSAGHAREIKKMVQGAGMQLSVVSSFTGDYSRLEESGSQACSEDQRHVCPEFVRLLSAQHALLSESLRRFQGICRPGL